MTGRASGGMIVGDECEEAPDRLRGQRSMKSARDYRVEAAAVLLVSVAVLILARIMQPNPAGFGTHEQLFVIPCAFRWLTGLPCPACGLTTAFALMARGDVLAALGAHVLGPALYAATWAMLIAAVTALVRGGPALPGWLRGSDGARVTMVLIGAGWLTNLAIHLSR
ncbi:MAG: DUF2752 domain-containing protein [Armatimonadota bacterium]